LLIIVADAHACYFAADAGGAPYPAFSAVYQPGREIALHIFDNGLTILIYAVADSGSLRLCANAIFIVALLLFGLHTKLVCASV